MILFEACGEQEGHSAYQKLSVGNLYRQYDFVRSVVDAALDVQRPYLSQTVIKSLNFHAITCLHTNAGEYRPCRVEVGTDPNKYVPPDHYSVQALMDDFVNNVNRNWDATDAVTLAAYVLWRLNWIHPFINGNGRTARVTCYYALCLKSGGWLPGTPILPELIRQNRAEYVQALKEADQVNAQGQQNLQPLHALLSRLISEQLASVTPQVAGPGGNAAVSSPSAPAPQH